MKFNKLFESNGLITNENLSLLWWPIYDLGSYICLGVCALTTEPFFNISLLKFTNLGDKSLGLQFSIFIPISLLSLSLFLYSVSLLSS